MSDRFYNLPIIIYEQERKPDGWTRFIKTQKTVKDILDTWDIDDKNDISEMSQVLRHLYIASQNIQKLESEIKELKSNVRILLDNVNQRYPDKNPREWTCKYMKNLDNLVPPTEKN